jgi:hypothetical protein
MATIQAFFFIGIYFFISYQTIIDFVIHDQHTSMECMCAYWGSPKVNFQNKLKKKLSYRIIRIKRIFFVVYWCITWTKSLCDYRVVPLLMIYFWYLECKSVYYRIKHIFFGVYLCITSTDNSFINYITFTSDNSFINYITFTSDNSFKDYITFTSDNSFINYITFTSYNSFINYITFKSEVCEWLGPSYTSINSGKNALNPYNSVTKFFFFNLFWKFTFGVPQSAPKKKLVLLT